MWVTDRSEIRCPHMYLGAYGSLGMAWWSTWREVNAHPASTGVRTPRAYLSEMEVERLLEDLQLRSVWMIRTWFPRDAEAYGEVSPGHPWE